MVGTAGLPHVIVRFYTVRSVKAARWSAFWALLFISALYLTAPATAAFARYYMIQSLHGKTTAELPPWFDNWERTGLILWLDDGDGRVAYHGPKSAARNEIFRSGKIGAAELAEIRIDHQKWLSSEGREGQDGRSVLRAKGVSGPDRDIIVLATPEMAALADWIIADRDLDLHLTIQGPEAVTHGGVRPSRDLRPKHRRTSGDAGAQVRDGERFVAICGPEGEPSMSTARSRHVCSWRSRGRRGQGRTLGLMDSCIAAFFLVTLL